jgi:hypothetical protein
VLSVVPTAAKQLPPVIQINFKASEAVADLSPAKPRRQDRRDGYSHD